MTALRINLMFFLSLLFMSSCSLIHVIIMGVKEGKQSLVRFALNSLSIVGLLSVVLENYGNHH
jgi:hypothetical protein